MRGVSTVVDVTIFLLLVSVAIVALTVPHQPGPDGRADETANALARATANVTFQLSPAGDSPAGPTRRVAGTHAGLLARAALANLHVDGHGVAPESGAFVAAVRNDTTRSIAWATERTAVTAVWQPYQGAPVRGRLHVGARPPAGVDVTTATLHVTTPVDACRRVNRTTSAEGYDAVGRAVAACLLDTTLPTSEVATPGPSSAAGVASQGRLAAYEAALDIRSTNESIEGRRARIVSTLAHRLATDMRDRFDTPAAAAAAVRTGTSRVVVREWDS